MSKLFMKVLKNRIYNKLDENQPQEQAVFRRGFSTTDYLHTINQLIEEANEYQIETHSIFVDFRKPFDSIDHEYLIQALEEQGVEMKITNIIRNLYKETTAYVKLYKNGEPFRVERGVRQVDPLSSNLFNAALEKIFRKLDWDSYGIRVNGKNLNHLRFADDIVLIGESKEIVTRLLRELVKASSVAGLKMNFAKTKYTSNKPGQDIKLDDIIIEKVDEYIYLGQTISIHSRLEKELQARKKKAWTGFWQLKQVFKSNIMIKSKVKILESCVLPILTYGAQTWVLTKSQEKNYKLLKDASSVVYSI